MFARTQRLTLRPGWPEDAAALARAVAHPEVVRMLAQVPWPYGIEHAEAFLARPRRVTDVALLILAHEGEREPRLVGCIGIHPDPEEQGGRELGYWLAPDAWGRGYATEAGRAVIDIARYALGLKRLSSGHFVDNPASGQVLTKLGFRPTGRTTARYSAGRDADVPCALYALDLAEADTAACAMAA